MSKYYKDKYDVVIIGGALAGLSSAIHLLNNGYDVLVLEQHNLPGGVATSFVRGGVELEASLHEMLSVGSKEFPLKIRTFLESNGVNVEWLQTPIAYRYVTDKDNVLVHTGEGGNFDRPARDIADACGDKDNKIYNEVIRFLKFCLHIHDECDYLSYKHFSKIKMIKSHLDFVKALGYSYKEVLDSFDLPQKAKDILSAYWMYLGSPIDDTPFIVYGYMIADYLGYGAYIPHHTSHEMSVKMAEAVMNKGGQIEFGQKVEKILVKNNKVYGVKTKRGDIIHADYVISGAYPNTVFSQMIEPLSEVPKKAIKTVNAMELGVSCFSLIMILDKDYRELGIKDYATFYAPHGLDSKDMYEKGKTYNKWNYLTSICTNTVHEDATPKGTCFYSITYLPNGESFKDVTIENYEEYKNQNIEHFLELESNRLGFNIKDHIIEMVVETPITISHYVGAYMGTIYGYRHMMNNHSAAREEMIDKEHFIKGLFFAGAHQTVGDGMAPAITNGEVAAMHLMKMDKRGKKS